MKQHINDFLKTIRHVKQTHVLSLDDEPIKPDACILELISKAIPNIPLVEFDNLKDRFDKKSFGWINTWPGEHYKLLTQLINLCNPDLILEIGTFRGASCLAMKQAAQSFGKVITYDIVPWDKIRGTHLRKEDFDDKLEQRIIDFSNINQIKTQKDLFERANFIFIDMAKDGVSEKLVCDFLDSLNHNKPYIIFDDIRFNNMLKFWRNIKQHKMDITSIGHWSGTGIAHWI